MHYALPFVIEITLRNICCSPPDIVRRQFSIVSTSWNSFFHYITDTPHHHVQVRRLQREGGVEAGVPQLQEVCLHQLTMFSLAA